jgi:hypothetical protein
LTRRTLLHAVAATLLLAGGAAVGLGVVVLHSLWWGLALGLAATVAALLALPGRWWARLPAAVGWAGAVGWLSASTPEGDYLVAGDLSGYVVLMIAFAVLVTGIVSLRPRGPGRRPRGGADSVPARSGS